MPAQRPDGVLREEASDHRSRLLVRGEAEAQLPGAAGLLQDQLHLQVRNRFHATVVEKLRDATLSVMSQFMMSRPRGGGAGVDWVFIDSDL